MAIEYREDGTPILTNKSLLSDVPAYTQALADTGLASDVRDSKFNDLLPAEPISPFPIGMIMPYMGSTAPDGWLLCDGREYDSTYFYSLAQVNPDFHSDGTFRVPDMRGRSPIGVGGEGVAREWALGERWGDQKPGTHTHQIRATANALDGRAAFVKGGGTPVAQHWVGLDYASSGVPTENGTPMHAAPMSNWTDADNHMGQGKNYQPSTGVNFIVYTGKRTLDANGVMLPECGQLPAIAPKTTRSMIEERLAQSGLSEEEVAMLEEHLEAIKEAE